MITTKVFEHYKRHRLPIDSDVTLVVGSEGIIFKCRKRVLGLGSSVFYKMFFGSSKENCQNPIELPEIDPEAFYYFLQFIYNGEKFDSAKYIPYEGSKWDEETYELNFCRKFSNLLLTATKYTSPKFHKFCISTVERGIKHFQRGDVSDMSLVLPVYSAACEFNAVELMEECERMLEKYYDKACNGEISELHHLCIVAFERFIKMSFELYLSSNQSNIHNLFHIIETYVIERNLQNKDLSGSDVEMDSWQKLVKLFLKLVNDKRMTKEMFILGPAISVLLNDEEYCKITMKFFEN